MREKKKGDGPSRKGSLVAHVFPARSLLITRNGRASQKEGKVRLAVRSRRERMQSASDTMRCMRRLAKTVTTASVVVALLTAASTAYAGPNEAAAEALFDEAKKLVAQKKYAEACPKFAESNRLDRGAGTLIHLGDCYEKTKQMASAWATYKEAASAAQALGRRDWEQLANKRASHLEKNLARLTVKVDAGGIEKLEVKRDGAPLTEASWGSALPVDVGTHEVVASAPGYKEFKTSVTLAKDGDKVEISVPKLEPLPKDTNVATKPTEDPKPQPKTPPPQPIIVHKDGSGQRTIGFIVAGVGVAGVAAGAVTGLMAMGKNNDSKEICPNDGACASPDAVKANDDAKTLGLVSTIAFGAGAAALAIGAVLIFTAPSDSRPTNAARAKLKLSPAIGPGNTGLFFSGTF
jgi:hypothetical protein